jgi:hypothetical protein
MSNVIYQVIGQFNLLVNWKCENQCHWTSTCQSERRRLTLVASHIVRPSRFNSVGLHLKRRRKSTKKINKTKTTNNKFIHMYVKTSSVTFYYGQYLKQKRRPLQEKHKRSYKLHNQPYLINGFIK